MPENNNQHHPLSPQSLLAGLVVTILGGVVVAHITGNFRHSPEAQPVSSHLVQEKDERPDAPEGLVEGRSDAQLGIVTSAESDSIAPAKTEFTESAPGGNADPVFRPDTSTESESQAPPVEADSTPEAFQPIHVGGDVQKPVKVSAPQPAYTKEARAAKIQGVVIVQAIINRDGSVRNVKVLKGLPFGLSEAAKTTVESWDFEPATLNGEPVAVYYNLTVNFRLAEAQALPHTSPQQPIHVGGDVQKPVKVSAPQPAYTEEARTARIQGVVIAQATIRRDGTVSSVKVLKGLPMGLSEKAVEAIETWKFEPATLNGQPVDVYYNLTVNFRLNGR